MTGTLLMHQLRRWPPPGARQGMRAAVWCVLVTHAVVSRAPMLQSETGARQEDPARQVLRVSADDPDDIGYDAISALAVLRRWWWVFLLALAVSLAGAVFAYLQEAPTYRARAELAVSGSTFEVGSPLGQQRPQDIERALLTEVRVLLSDPIRRSAAELVGSDHSVNVNLLQDTHIIQVVAESSNPESAAQAANAYALSYVDFRGRQVRERLLTAREALEAQLQAQPARPAPMDPEQGADGVVTPRTPARAADIQAQIDTIDLALALEQFGVSMFAPANAPTGRSSPSMSTNLLLGLAVGLAVGTSAAFMLEARSARRSQGSRA